MTIVARIDASSDKIEFVKAKLLKLIEPTLKDTSCIQYDLHQDKENAAIFLFYENWKSRKLWQEHMNNTHLVAFMKTTEGVVASFTLNEMTKL